MITHLRGKLVEKNPTDLIVECNGVGYFLNISLHTFAQISDKEDIFIYTYLQVREDAQTLFGFADKVERALFKKLISVSGIGASTARTMLSSLTPDQVVSAIHSEDVEEIKSVKGIGAKTAQRVIIDLKDKLSDIGQTDDVNKILTSKDNTHKEEALSALETLGYTRKQSEKVVKKILSNNPEATVEALIKLSLKNL
ncbi:Holliday junction branch migration protein RuvA [Mesonia aquimarina]|uniref:Holliday junction branch migration protein RuvA n=1 Tax=Mesonia aquimarina TaxID=1504967 RepID=UPI000EF5C877|nr:Holliday junction branch migration protein RuvA [Mesonia aquimarina]